MNIVVEKRLFGDYRAFVEGRSDIWGIGKDIDEAIGSLIRFHKEFFGIENILYWCRNDSEVKHE